MTRMALVELNELSSRIKDDVAREYMEEKET
jgi:hypothetical protein